MRIFPATGREWSDVALAPFKTYPILVFLIAPVWSAEMRGEPMILFILLGYIICLIVTTWMAMVDTFCVQSATPYWRWSATIILLGFLFALRWLPTLAA
jgi:hypothetical protein